MKFALIIMTELRAIKKTIKNLTNNIIDFYNADVFILCQKTFGDDEININLFKNVIYKELYDKPKPEEYFNNHYILNKNLDPNVNWNNNGCLQIYINYHKMALVLKNYVNNYDYFITIRTDAEILFPFPNKELFNEIPKGLYTFDAEYAKEWGGIGTSIFTHKDYILEYLNSYYDEIINTSSNSEFLLFNQEKLLNYCLMKKNLKFNYIKNLNFYYTAEKVNDYTTWSKPYKDTKRNIICKYEHQVNESYDNLKLWKNNYEWCIENNCLILKKNIKVKKLEMNNILLLLNRK
jgi:hypothetical protein